MHLLKVKVTPNILVLVIVLIIALIKFTSCADTRVISKFQSRAIVPDVIEQPPRELLFVAFNNTKIANLGNTIHTKFLQNEGPTIFLSKDVKLANSTFISILMVNADAPTRRNPNLRNVLHWMLTNIRPDNYTSGEEKAEYFPINPARGSGQHRIVLLMYNHPTKLVFNETIIKRNSTESLRYKFSVKDFEKKYKLGAPLAGNFFRCSFHYN